MLADLNPDARALADYMSALSEEAYCAGWMEGLEYALWDAVSTGPSDYGRLAITAEIVQKLKALSSACNGWIHFDEDAEETFIPRPAWLLKYQNNKRKADRARR